MNQNPLFLTNFALTRLLKELLMDVGFSDTKADVVAQVHIQLSPIPTRWSDFLGENCSSCKLTPDLCLFMNPSADQCVEGATPDSLRAAHALMIETGRMTDCPSWSPADE